MTLARLSWEYICALNSRALLHYARLLAFLLFVDCCSLLLLLGAYSTQFYLAFYSAIPSLPMFMAARSSSGSKFCHSTNSVKISNISARGCTRSDTLLGLRSLS